MEHIVENILNSKMLQVKKGIFETLLSKIDTRMKELKAEYAKEVFAEALLIPKKKRTMQEIKEKAALKAINKQKSAEYGRIDREV
jgi:hypothetical protein